MTESKGSQKDTQRPLNTKRHLRTTKRRQTPKTCKTKFRNENNNRDMQNIHGDVKRVLRDTKQPKRDLNWPQRPTNHKQRQEKNKITTAKPESLLWVSDFLQEGESLSICLGAYCLITSAQLNRKQTKWVSVINPTWMHARAASRPRALTSLLSLLAF